MFDQLNSFQFHIRGARKELNTLNVSMVSKSEDLQAALQASQIVAPVLRDDVAEREGNFKRQTESFAGRAFHIR